MVTYAIIGGVGFLFLILSFLLGEMADSLAGLFEHDVDVDVGGHDVVDVQHDGEVHTGPSFFSIRMLAAFATGFGVVGALAVSRGWDPLMAALPGLGTGALMALASYGFSTLLYRQQATSSYTPSEIVGLTAEVITPIPQNGIGEIALVVRGSREHLAARSVDGQSVGAGTTVKIANVSGTTAVVKQP